MPGSKWKRRDPNIFPIRYADVVELSLSLGQAVRLESCVSYADARVKMDRFREWRFCLRERGGPNNRGWKIEQNYRIATRLDGLAIMVEVKPIRDARSLMALNPHLSDILPIDND